MLIVKKSGDHIFKPFIKTICCKKVISRFQKNSLLTIKTILLIFSSRTDTKYPKYLTSYLKGNKKAFDLNIGPVFYN